MNFEDVLMTKGTQSLATLKPHQRRRHSPLTFKSPTVGNYWIITACTQNIKLATPDPTLCERFWEFK
jgi:hypothetical protein